MVDELERALAVSLMVDDHEPLMGGAEDHGLATAPAVGIGVREGPRGDQAAALRQPADDVLVHLQHAPSHERLRPGGEATGLVDGTGHLESDALANREVLLAVAGC